MNQNRMTSGLPALAAQLRELINFGWNASRGTRIEASQSESCCGPGFSAAAFNRLALELFARQFQLNAPYRRLCEARGVAPGAVRDWRQIPAVPTAAFKELELTCLPPAERVAVFHSSGTTEQRPSRHFHSAKSLAVYETSLLPWFRAHVLPDCEPGISSLQLILLAPPPEQAPHSSLVHMFEAIRRSLGAPASAFVGNATLDGSWTLDFAATTAALSDDARLKTRNPALILGTAFSFVHLLDYLREHNLRFELAPGSRVMETGGYKGRSRRLARPDLHALVTSRLGVPPSHIVCEYGMSELSSQAYDRTVQDPESSFENPRRRFQFPLWARAQVVSPETGREVADGQTGLVRVLDLANVFSVIALQTEDLAIRRGDGFELLGRATRVEPRGCSLMSADSLTR